MLNTKELNVHQFLNIQFLYNTEELMPPVVKNEGQRLAYKKCPSTEALVHHHLISFTPHLILFTSQSMQIKDYQ